jgi:hypothetical protein
MAECSVAIDQITDDAVHAKDEITATDLVLEGEGLDMASETHDASVTAYERSKPRQNIVDRERYP